MYRKDKPPYWRFPRGVTRALSLILVISLVFSSFFIAFNEINPGVAASYLGTVSSKENSVSQSADPWVYPTTTMQEPGYTNGTYIMAALNSVGHINIYDAESAYSFYLLDEVYDSATNLLPNETISPWLATSWTEYNLTNMSSSAATSTYLGLAGSGNMTTYDPLTGVYEPVKYVYQVNIRPGVQWTDYQPGTNTYVFSNHTSFNGPSGNPHSHTY
ncbi:MAG: hypothetical protein QXN66_04405, partial [Thermoplasmatales archaeon]